MQMTRHCSRVIKLLQGNPSLVQMRNHFYSASQGGNEISQGRAPHNQLMQNLDSIPTIRTHNKRKGSIPNKGTNRGKKVRTNIIQNKQNAGEEMSLADKPIMPKAKGGGPVTLASKDQRRNPKSAVMGLYNQAVQDRRLAVSIHENAQEKKKSRERPREDEDPLEKYDLNGVEVFMKDSDYQKYRQINRAARQSSRQAIRDLYFVPIMPKAYGGGPENAQERKRSTERPREEEEPLLKYDYNGVEAFMKESEFQKYLEIKRNAISSSNKGHTDLRFNC